MRSAQERLAQILIAIPATATSCLQIKVVAEESGKSTHRAAIANDSAAADQIAFAPDVSAINANRQIVQQPVIHSGQETAVGNAITVRVLVLIIYHDILAAAHGESTPASVRSRGRRRGRNVLADHVLAFLNRWIDFHDRSAIRVRVLANLVHPPFPVSSLHGGPRETDLVHRSELFWRNHIIDVRKPGDRLGTQNVKGRRWEARVEEGA